MRLGDDSRCGPGAVHGAGDDPLQLDARERCGRSFGLRHPAGVERDLGVLEYPLVVAVGFAVPDEIEAVAAGIDRFRPRHREQRIEAVVLVAGRGEFGRACCRS